MRRDTSRCVEIRRDTLRYVEIRRDTSRCVEMRRDTSRYVEMRRDASRYVEMRRDTSRYVEIRRDASRYIEMCRDASRCVEIHRDTKAKCGARRIWHHFIKVRHHYLNAFFRIIRNKFRLGIHRVVVEPSHVGHAANANIVTIIFSLLSLEAKQNLPCRAYTKVRRETWRRKELPCVVGGHST